MGTKPVRIPEDKYEELKQRKLEISAERGEEVSFADMFEQVSADDIEVEDDDVLENTRGLLD